MSETFNQHPVGFVGATNDQLALRPLFLTDDRDELLDGVKAELGDHGIVSHRIAKSQTGGELLLSVQFFDSLTFWARQKNWTILPEAAALAGESLPNITNLRIAKIREDRTLRLMPAILPRSLPRFNLAAQIAPLIPTKLAVQLRAQAGGRCECCARIKGLESAQCEPIWNMRPKPDVDTEIEQRSGVAELASLAVLCDDCQAVIHFVARADDNYRSIDHLAMVNGITKAEAEDVIAMASFEWAEWSHERWSYDTIELLRYLDADPPGKVPPLVERDF